LGICKLIKDGSITLAFKVNFVPLQELGRIAPNLNLKAIKNENLK
jgi:hypothetical protein